MSLKINELKFENVKRVKAVKLEPTSKGLTIIGGNNNQGKTSILDAIAWALGGNGYRPSKAQREDSVLPPHLHIVMSNGLVVERNGKNSDLKVTDPTGKKAGQQLLDSFISKLALDLPKFMESNASEKANTLLNIIGVAPKLHELEKKEKELYQERLTVGRIADQKKKFADEQEYFPDAPKDLISASELIRQQQEILVKNGENQKKREAKFKYERELEEAKKTFEEAKRKLEIAEDNFLTASKSAVDLQDESTEELEKNLAEIDEINRKVRANLDKSKAEDDAQEYYDQYTKLTTTIETVRREKKELLNHAELPLPELSVEEGQLKYKGQEWDNMSGSDRLKVSTAIVRKLNPQCGFVLIDKLEQMDMESLKEFGDWLEKEDLQVIATRVSTGSECSIIISDGYALEPEVPEKESIKPIKTWKAGEF